MKHQTKYDLILDILRTDGPLSTYGVAKRMDEVGQGVKSPGQVLSRLRILAKRGKVDRVISEAGYVWQIVD